MDISKHFEKHGLNADIILLLDGIFWLLDIVLWDTESIPDLSVEYRQHILNMHGIDMNALVDLEMDYNRSWHDLSEEELIEAFLYLSKNDLIFCERCWDLDPRRSQTKRCTLDKETLKSVLDPKNHDLLLFYGLTAKGGELWESITSADWDRHIYSSARTLDDRGLRGLWNRFSEFLVSSSWISESTLDAMGLKGRWQCTVEGSDRELIERYIAESSLLTPPNPAEVVWTELSPWQPTYWKTFQNGYRVDFTVRDGPTIASFMRQDYPLLASEPEWYRSPLK